MSRRSVTGQRLAGIGAIATGLLLGSAAALALGLPSEEAHRHSAVSGLARITALSAEARRSAPPSPGERFLKRSFAGATWHLASSDRERTICFVLVVPRTSDEGTCGAQAQFRKQNLVLYTLARKTGRPRHSTLVVVYGWVTPRVRHLGLRLSDCSRLAVALGSRPLFWRFVPVSLLRRGIYPTGFVATLNGQEEIRGRLVRRGRSEGGTKARCEG